MLKLATKCITRENWPRILQRSFACADNLFPGFHGAVALIRIERVQEPLKVFSCKTSVTLADNGYYWIQLAPKNEHWWLTAMLDSDKNILQYYFDITLENRICGSASKFYDLFLDVVALPDGNFELLDKEELDEALKLHLINHEQYNTATQTADMLMNALPFRIQELNRFMHACFDALNSKLPEYP